MMRPKTKKFKEIREKTRSKGEKVYSKKIEGVQLVITKESGKFVTYVDGDRLDEFNNKVEAKRAGAEFIKQAQGK
jgi:hypothetical protein